MGITMNRFRAPNKINVSPVAVFRIVVLTSRDRQGAGLLFSILLGALRKIGFCRLPRLIVAVCVGVVVSSAVSAWAQTSTSVAQRMLSDQLVILARQSLVGTKGLHEHQLIQARLLLDLALEFNSNDAQVWRLSMELAHRGGDPKTEFEALRRYCGLRPGDDAAQLKWIMGMVGLRQTLPERMAVVQKFFQGQETEQFSAALRSRLASYLAQAALETGDTEDFVRYLKDAVTLDRSNPEAAKLATDWLEASGASEDRVGESLMHQIRADPMNPLPRRRLARILLSQGAYRPAAQQYQVTQRLAGSAVDERFVYNWVLSVAGSGEIEEAVQLLAQYEAIRSPRVNSSQPTDGPGPPAGLPMDLELLRLAILHQSGQRGRAVGSYQRLASLLQKRLKEGDDDAQADLMWLGLLFDQEVPTDEALAEFAATRPEGDPLATRLTGWLRLRQGNTDGAQKVLGVWYVHEDPFEAYGLAKAYQVSGDPRYRSQLQQVVRMAPSNLAGVLAALDLIAEGIDSEPTDIGGRLTRLIDGWPSMLASPDLKAQPWWRLTVDVEPKRFGYLDPISMRLTLRNMTDFPLSLGPDGVVPTDVLAQMTLRRHGGSIGGLPPVAAGMDRQIQLGPFEAIDVSVRMDYGELGRLFSLNPAEAISLDITAVLDPRIGPNGRVVPSPLGGADSVHLIERFATALTMQRVEQWIAMLSNTEPDRQMKAAALLVRAASALASDETEDAQAVVDRITQAVGHAYPQWNPMMQAWVVRFLVPGADHEALFDTIHESAQRSQEALVWVVYLATQVSDPDAAVINTALRHPDAKIAAFAGALREDLELAAAQPKAEHQDEGEGEEGQEGLLQK